MKVINSGSIKFVVYNQSLFGTGANKRKILRKKFDSFQALRIIKEIDIPDNPIEISINEPKFITSDNAQIDLSINFEVVPNISETDDNKFIHCVEAFDREKYINDITSPKEWIYSYIKSVINYLKVFSFKELVRQKEDVIKTVEKPLLEILNEKNFKIHTNKINIVVGIFEDYSKYVITNSHHQPILNYLQDIKSEGLKLKDEENRHKSEINKRLEEETKIQNEHDFKEKLDLEKVEEEKNRHTREMKRISLMSQEADKDIDLKHAEEMNKREFLELLENNKKLKTNALIEEENGALNLHRKRLDLSFENEEALEKETLTKNLIIRKIETHKNEIVLKEYEAKINKIAIDIEYEGDRIKQEIDSKSELNTKLFTIISQLLEKELLLDYLKLSKMEKVESIAGIAKILSNSVSSVSEKLTNLKTLNIFDSGGINSIIGIIAQLSNGLLESNHLSEIVNSRIKNIITEIDNEGDSLDKNTNSKREKSSF